MYQDKNRGREKLKPIKVMPMKAEWRGCECVHKIKEGSPEGILYDGLAHVRHQGELQNERDAACGYRQGTLDHVERPKEQRDTTANEAKGERYQAVRASNGVDGILVAEPHVQGFFEEKMSLSYRGDDASPQTAYFSFFSGCHKRNY